MSTAYQLPLDTKEAQMALMERLGMAMGDVIHSCRRAEGTNADTNLTEIEYNTGAVAEFLAHYSIHAIYFTSAFVATKFGRHFREVTEPYPHLQYITLPSPSPRFARMSLTEKAHQYRALLPPL
jgi:G:T/U-mismatch repair DNA glycosylase